MVRLRTWHLGGILSILWFAYHVWSEWHRHDGTERFAGRATTEQTEDGKYSPSDLPLRG